MQNNSLTGTTMAGEVRVLSQAGRSGLNTTSIHSRIEIPEHNLNDAKGSLTIWVLSLEDLSTAAHLDQYFSIHTSHYGHYSLLSDCKEDGNFDESVFSLTWGSRWYPQLYAKFYRGNIYDDAYQPVPRAFVAAGHLDLHRKH